MKVTFIIPLKDAALSCQRTLRSIALQDQALIQKVIVVENGSHEFTAPEVPFDLEIHHLPEGNRSRARNLGAQLSTTEFLAFVDSDVVLPPDWLSSCLSVMDGETLAVQGPIVPVSVKETFLQELRLKRSQLRGGNYLTLDRPEAVLNSAAFVISRDTFFSAGRFDESLPRFEDSDLTLRLLSLPGTIKGIRAPESQVYYEGSLTSYIVREFERGMAVVKFHEKWTPGGKASALRSLIWNAFIWPAKPLSARNRFTVFLGMLNLVYLLGNLTGLLKICISPRKGQKNIFRKRGKIVIA